MDAEDPPARLAALEAELAAARARIAELEARLEHVAADLDAEQLRARHAELEQENRRALEAARLKGEFLANVSHELRTPLNAIIGFAELLDGGKIDPASPHHREFVAAILASARHLLGLINDVLDLAKVEAGKLIFQPRPVALADLIGEVVAVLRTDADARGIAVTVEVAPGLDGLLLDPARLRQVLFNYLSNAIKFTPAGGRVAVRARPEDELTWRLEVEDTGPGIAAEDLGRLFVEFQQLESALTRRHGGTGLGLALTRRLVEAQGGSVGVRSEPGQGSVFHAILPRVARAGDARVVRRTLLPWRP